MNLIKNGLIKVNEELKALKLGWDRSTGKPINKTVLKSVLDMSFIADILNKFKLLNLKETDIDVIPTPDGNIQYKAERNEIYLEITVTKESYNKWTEEFKKKYG